MPSQIAPVLRTCSTSAVFNFDVFAANNALNVDLNLDDSPAGANPGNSNSNTFTEQAAAALIADNDVTITNTGNPASPPPPRRPSS